MRKINYILISDTLSESGHPATLGSLFPDFGYHFCVNPQGLVIEGLDLSRPTTILPGPIYNPDKYNRCSITIRYCGSLRPESWILNPETGEALKHETWNLKPETWNLKPRAALIRLLVKLRRHFPDAKILSFSELLPETLNLKPETSGRIHVLDSMNLLRRELSNYP